VRSVVVEGGELECSSGGDGLLELELRWRRDARRREVEGGGKPRRVDVDEFRREEERAVGPKMGAEVVEKVRKVSGEVAGCWRAERSAKDPTEDRTEDVELDGEEPTELWTNVLANVEGDAMAERRREGR
jgi:hypothetical protein